MLSGLCVNAARGIRVDSLVRVYFAITKPGLAAIKCVYVCRVHVANERIHLFVVHSSSTDTTIHTEYGVLLRISYQVQKNAIRILRKILYVRVARLKSRDLQLISYPFLVETVVK